MDNNRLIPVDSDHDVVSFDLILDGEAIDGTIQVMSILVNKEVNKVPTAKVVLRDGDAAKEDWEVSNSDSFLPGSTVEIKAGRDGENKLIFKGLITKQKISIGDRQSSQLLIECKDDSIKSTVGRKNKYFTDKKDSDIIGEVLGQYGASGEIEATKLEHQEIVQFNCTDWDFINLRAEANGLLVVPDDGKVNIVKPDTSGKNKEALTLIFGATLIEFESELDAKDQWASVKASSWDYSKQALFEAETTNADFDESGNVDGKKLSEALGLKDYELRHSGNLLKEELQSWVDAKMLKSRMSKIAGRAKFIGFSALKPGMTVALQGVGKRFNGKTFVSGIRHELVDGTWFTHAQLGLPKDWFNSMNNASSNLAGGLTPGVSGLQIGVVMQLQDDPNSEDRILVKLPTLDNNAKGIWTRVSTLDAGENRGSFFRPEIGDEVIVGFINDDPRDAVTLGMLNSSAKPAPIKAEDVNHEKGWVTRSEMKILFHDDKKEINIETPAGNSIVISEDKESIVVTDQNNNVITMDPKGIAMESPKDIKIDAQGKIDISAAKDLSIKGMNVKIEAQANFEAKGSAGAKMESSAIAEVKGSLVKIN